jgi:hypothetical protein
MGILKDTVTFSTNPALTEQARTGLIAAHQKAR